MQVAHERQLPINIARTGQREAEQAGSKGTGGCDGQHGRPAKCEGGCLNAVAAQSNTD